MAERSCLTCRWAITVNAVAGACGVARGPILKEAFKILPKATHFVLKSSSPWFFDKRSPHTDCPTWEPKETSG